MSGQTQKPRRRRSTEDANLQLAEQCGSRRGYDPFPPDGYLCFQDFEFRLSPTALRLYSWLLSKTIRAKKGGRTHVAKDYRGDLTLTHATDDLGISLPHASKCFDELVQAGLARRDEEHTGRLQLWARPEYDPRRKGEGDGDGDKKELCTYKLPEYLVSYFQQLDPKLRAQYESGYQAVQDYGKKLEADAIAAARERKKVIETEYLKSIGFEREERRGRPKEKPKARLVELKIEESVPNFVHISSVHKSDGNSHEMKTASVRKSASLSLSEMTEIVSKSEEKPVYLPTSEPVLESVQAIEERFGPFEPGSAKRDEAAALAVEFDIPDKCVALAIEDKIEDKRAVGYKISSAGALIGFVRASLPGWIQQNGRLIDAYRQYAQAPAEGDEASHKTQAELDEEIERLRRELRGESRAQKAGHA